MVLKVLMLGSFLLAIKFKINEVQLRVFWYNIVSGSSTTNYY